MRDVQGASGDHGCRCRRPLGWRGGHGLRGPVKQLPSNTPEGKSKKEALRALKRRIRDAVWRQLQVDPGRR